MIAKYIANRIDDQFLVIDLGCGIGGNLIQFANQCGFVIGVEIREDSIVNAQENCKHYKIEDKVDFVHGNLLYLRKLKGDVAFIHPTASLEKQTGIDIFRDLYPNIYTLVETALSVAPNMIMLLPKGIDISSLVTLFDVLKNTFQHHYPYHTAVEIEMIIVNKKLEYYVVYVGEITAVSPTHSLS